MIYQILITFATTIIFSTFDGKYDGNIINDLPSTIGAILGFLCSFYFLN